MLHVSSMGSDATWSCVGDQSGDGGGGRMAAHDCWRRMGAHGVLHVPRARLGGVLAKGGGGGPAAVSACSPSSRCPSGPAAAAPPACGPQPGGGPRCAHGRPPLQLLPAPPTPEAGRQCGEQGFSAGCGTALPSAHAPASHVLPGLPINGGGGGAQQQGLWWQPPVPHLHRRQHCRRRQDCDCNVGRAAHHTRRRCCRHEHHGQDCDQRSADGRGRGRRQALVRCGQRRNDGACVGCMAVRRRHPSVSPELAVAGL